MPADPALAARPILVSPTRAEMLSTLAAATLHDVSHLLDVVLGCAELVLDDPALGVRSRRLVEEATQAGARAGTLAQQMLAFARGDADAPAGMVDVVTALRAAEPLVHRIAGAGVVVTIEAGGAPLWVRAAPIDLDRILVNLVANGREAMPDGGRLCLRVALAPRDPDPRLAGPPVRLTVGDTGHGIARRDDDRHVEAVVARDGDAHRWLGLAVVREIVERLGGTIRVTSGPAGATTVVVDLPAVDLPAAP